MTMKKIPIPKVNILEYVDISLKLEEKFYEKNLTHLYFFPFI